MSDNPCLQEESHSTICDRKSVHRVLPPRVSFLPHHDIRNKTVRSNQNSTSKQIIQYLQNGHKPLCSPSSQSTVPTLLQEQISWTSDDEAEAVVYIGRQQRDDHSKISASEIPIITLNKEETEELSSNTDPEDEDVETVVYSRTPSSEREAEGPT
eukprot:TRINITY_DN13063_c0_g1_i2.p1 TRINITY_DN13063_c0_g1~~TRINITY_DN13063_c0_g1_i2.p1  ORF type:complete len:155 (+),score=22.29 TRINITY_DN13063_c0_g1_i2:68-532(+)